RRVHRPRALEDHGGRRDIRCSSLRVANGPHSTVPGSVLLWWDRAADCCGRGPRHGAADRGPPDNSTLRRLLRAGWTTSSRTRCHLLTAVSFAELHVRSAP